MKKHEFVKAVAKRNHLSQRQAYQAIIAVMDTLRLALLHEDSVEIGGFGSFQTTTGIKGVRIPVFHAHYVLKQVINTETKLMKTDNK